MHVSVSVPKRRGSKYIIDKIQELDIGSNRVDVL